MLELKLTRWLGALNAQGGVSPKALPDKGAIMTNSVSSKPLPLSDLGKLIPPSHVESDDSQPGLDDRLAYLNKWDPPTEDEWRRATWIVARELIRGIAGSSWRALTKLEVLATRKGPYGR